jgi:hypothetical protein
MKSIKILDAPKYFIGANILEGIVFGKLISQDLFPSQAWVWAVLIIIFGWHLFQFIVCEFGDLKIKKLSMGTTMLCILILFGWKDSADDYYRVYSGEVVGKYISNNHATPTLVVKTRNGKIEIEAWKIYQNASNGDSVFKTAKNLEIYLKK